MKNEMEYIPLKGEQDEGWYDTILLATPFIVVGAIFGLYFFTL